jgi:hypothetical protein
MARPGSRAPAGRGVVVGIGEAPSLIHHAQIAWMPTAERRRYALTGPGLISCLLTG